MWWGSGEEGRPSVAISRAAAGRLAAVGRVLLRLAVALQVEGHHGMEDSVLGQQHVHFANPDKPVPLEIQFCGGTNFNLCTI